MSAVRQQDDTGRDEGSDAASGHGPGPFSAALRALVPRREQRKRVRGLLADTSADAARRMAEAGRVPSIATACADVLALALGAGGSARIVDPLSNGTRRLSDELHAIHARQNRAMDALAEFTGDVARLGAERRRGFASQLLLQAAMHEADAIERSRHAAADERQS